MSKTFTAVVGGGRREFTLYTDIASRSSKFFHAALRRDWKEAHQNTVVLHEVTVTRFESYLQWLNTNDHSFLGECVIAELAQLYTLGDFLDDLGFRVAMLGLIAKRAMNENVHPRCGVVSHIWDQTTKSSPLRKMILEILATLPMEYVAEEFAEAGEAISREFMADCLRRIGELKAVPKEGITGEDHRRALQSRRDEIIGELLGGQQPIVIEDDGLAEV